VGGSALVVVKFVLCVGWQRGEVAIEGQVASIPTLNNKKVAVPVVFTKGKFNKITKVPFVLRVCVRNTNSWTLPRSQA
jgi:hypothetical protein